MPTRAPPARIDAASSASRPVRRAPSRPRGAAAGSSVEPRGPASGSRTVQHPALTRSVNVLTHLQDHAERLVEVGVLQRQQGLSPRDRLAHAGELVELLPAQPFHGAAYAFGNLVWHAGQPR